MKYVEQRNFCENCGKPSHCGISLHETIQNYNEPPITIKTCNYCRCGDCVEKKEFNK
jgi:hypothetical protein